ncbi:hypothetical protein ACTXT7_007173 [Hymenolepis weldensis]
MLTQGSRKWLIPLIKINYLRTQDEKDPYVNREQNTQPEQTRSPVFQKFRHFENDISIIQRTAATTSSTTNIRVSLITLTAPSFIHLLFFHLWSLSTL